MSDAPPDLHGLPLFPLQTVLFPGGVLPLRIFEVRYLDMIGRCHKAGTPFGVVCLTAGSEVQRPGPAIPPGSTDGAGFHREVFHSTGTLAHIERLDRPQPGLMMIRCTGGRRFRLIGSERMVHGLWTGEARSLDDDAEVAVPDDLVHVANALERLLGELAARLRPGEEMPVAQPFRFSDSGWVSNRWCELLPLPPELRQQLMTLDSPLVRLELVGDLLGRAGAGRGRAP